jgi:hypothetical protein
MDNIYDTYTGPSLKPEELKPLEIHDAWSQTRDQVMKPFDGISEAIFEISERMTDQREAVRSFVLGETFAVKHCRDLERQAQQSEINGHPLAADHFRKREFSFALWTLGYNHEVTTHLRKQLFKTDYTDCPWGRPRQDAPPYTPPSQRFVFPVIK